MEYYSTMKKNKLLIYVQNLKCTMVSERSYIVFDSINMVLWKRRIYRSMVARDWREGRIDCQVTGNNFLG